MLVFAQEATYLYSILYHYTVNNDDTQYNICSNWCLDTRVISFSFLHHFLPPGCLYY